MNRKILSTASILVILMLLLIACQPLTPDQILSQSRLKMKDVKSMAIGMEVRLTSQGQNVMITGEGVARLPDQSYMKMSAEGQGIELIAQPQDKFFMKGDTTQGKWIPLTKQQVNEGTGVSLNVLEVQTILAGLYTAPVLVNEEKINNADCYHLVFSINSQKYLEQLLPAAIPNGVDPKTTTVEGELWIGKEDLLMRKVRVDLVMQVKQQPAGTVTIFTNSKFNEAVEIPKPE
jgi:hypothetical protein